MDSLGKAGWAGLAWTMMLALQPAAAEVPGLSSMVPSDAVVAYFVTPPLSATPTGPVRSSLGFAVLLADQAQSLGLLSKIDATTRAWIDTLTSAGDLLTYPHAAALFDIDARRLDGGGHRLAGLQAALIIETGGNHERIEQRIQHLLNTYTNSDETTLKRGAASQAAVYTLTDRRLPDWCVLRWGPVGERYVVSIGVGTYERVRQTLRGEAPALSSDTWFAEAYRKTAAKKGFFTCFARFDRIDFSADTELARKVGAVRRALNFQNVDQGFWTVGFEGRAVDAKAFVRRENQNELASLTLPSLPGTPLDELIPAQATSYAIFNTSPQTSLEATCEVYLAARSPQTQEEIRRYWRTLQSKSGVDIHRDIVAHLARGAVIHNHPPHLLRLPLAWTFVARAEGDVQAVRDNIDAVCRAWRDELAAFGAIRLRHEPDGVWFLDFGLPGPAVGMRGSWIVVSHSPFAVRENLLFLAGPPPPPATTGPDAASTPNPARSDN